MTQFYIVEVKQHPTGEFEHVVHYAWDEDPDKARLKGESKYHEVLTTAAISNTLLHSAIMFGTDGYPVHNQCYKHVVEEQVNE